MRPPDTPSSLPGRRFKNIKDWLSIQFNLDFSRERRQEFWLVLIVVGLMGSVFSALLFLLFGEGEELWIGVLGTALAAALYTRPRWH